MGGIYIKMKMERSEVDYCGLFVVVFAFFHIFYLIA